jgi:hypothetical protein
VFGGSSLAGDSLSLTQKMFVVDSDVVTLSVDGALLDKFRRAVLPPARKGGKRSFGAGVLFPSDL